MSAVVHTCNPNESWGRKITVSQGQPGLNNKFQVSPSYNSETLPQKNPQKKQKKNLISLASKSFLLFYFWDKKVRNHVQPAFTS